MPGRRTGRSTKRKREAEESEQAAAADGVPKTKKSGAVLPGHRGDGNFYIGFVKVGQGDCIIVSTPAGKSILIDCGVEPRGKEIAKGTGKETQKQEDERLEKEHWKPIRDTLTSVLFLGGSKRIDHLILTHPDQDHHNLLSSVLPHLQFTYTNKGRRSTADRAQNDLYRVGEVYHSTTISHKKWETRKTREWLQKCVPNRANVKEVTLVDTARKFHPWGGTEGNIPANLLVASNSGTASALKILEEPNCKIYLLVSNLKDQGDYNRARSADDTHPPALTDNDTKEGFNRKSIVTLIEVFGKKIMLCADATIRTEEYLCRHFSLHIGNLDLMQVPHHGSAVTSLNHPKFIEMVKPKNVVICTGKEVTKDRLPGYQTIISYLSEQATGAGGKHKLFCWNNPARDPAVPQALRPKIGNFRSPEPSFVGNYTTKQVGHTPAPHAEFEVDRGLWTTGSNGTQRFMIDKDDRKLVRIPS